MELMQPLQVDSNKQILEIILDEDELSWQQIIYELVKTEQMDPWDIEISTLTAKFMEVIRALQELDCRVSGKMVLASALLLKIKTDRLMGEDFTALDQLLASTEEEDIDLLEEDYEGRQRRERPDLPKIYPKSPQPRQRKVSVYDLVTALEQALEVTSRRNERTLDGIVVEVKVPEKSVDISAAMNSLLKLIAQRFQQTDTLHFHDLTPTDNKLDKVLVFIPLLHLTNERRVDLSQRENFGPIGIALLDDTPVVYQETEG